MSNANTTAIVIDVAGLRQWLSGNGEVAFLDVREEGQHGAGHPLLAVNAPYSRLELVIGQLVPRRSCPIVLLDDGDGVAEKAARRLAALGYEAAHVLEGGVAAWSRAGHPLFPSTNVPSKAFAEIVEHEYGTPAISAAELDRSRRAGDKIVVLDSRPLDEYARFHVPGAITCPGAELALRFDDLVPDPETTVVVSCAGRTRGIIGAQSLRTAGVPNRVLSLEGGTQGWRLGGLDLEQGMTTSLKPPSANAVTGARKRAEAVAARFGIRHIDRATLDAWRREPDRTIFVLDVRTPDEFAAGHLPGSLSAPGGQVVQAIDRWVGVRGARLVLVDDMTVRAIMTAQWLKQMGWDVAVLDHPFDGASLTTGIDAPQPVLPEVSRIMPVEAAHWLDGGAASVAIMPSADYRKAHSDLAIWAIRPRLDRLPPSVLHATRIAVFSEDDAVGALAAADLAELTGRPVALVEGGIEAWRAAGRGFEASPDQPPDAERIDTIFWNYDRHAGNQEAMRAYLRWETELPGEVARDGLAGFRIGAG